MSDHTAVLTRLLDQAGTTYSRQAGFTVRDTPSPLYQLSVLAILLAKPISADLAVAGAAELRRAGGRTPRGMLALTWQQRVDALSRAHYRRLDESSATRLEQAANAVLERWGGDLRRLGEESGRDVARAGRLLTEIPGIGPSGADIFLREAQAVWPWARPYLDERVRAGAAAVGLPSSERALRPLFDGQDAARLAAALVRAGLDDELAARVRRAG